MTTSSTSIKLELERLMRTVACKSLIFLMTVRPENCMSRCSALVNPKIACNSYSSKDCRLMPVLRCEMIVKDVLKIPIYQIKNFRHEASIISEKNVFPMQ